jgi:hypothetical protein
MLRFWLIDLPALLVDLAWYAYLAVMGVACACAWVVIIVTMLRWAWTGHLG